MTIEYICNNPDAVKKRLNDSIEVFCKFFNPAEKSIYVFEDVLTGAVFCECHINARVLQKKGTVDSPLDAENQSEYRANRDIVEDDVAFFQMKEDARSRRSFSNIVAEFNLDFDEEHPLKVIGGQHRFVAISEALDMGVDELHGIKVYFGLTTEQRLDVQLISNTNIAVSSDLLDRMMETVKGPELRNWCQTAGLLGSNEDFADKKRRGSKFTVRAARTFIMNFYEGGQVHSIEFPKKKTIPVLAKTGGTDEDWEKLKISNSQLWSDPNLLVAGKAFARLIEKQKSAFAKGNGKTTNGEYADKASSYAMIAAWAYVSGTLQDNPKRLERHYALCDLGKPDPLNTKALTRARHKTDPDNYRGLGTRTDAKERGRLAELFYIQAEKGSGISKELADAAIARYYAKQAMLEALEAESKVMA